ncbi:hypothetical protein EC968_001076 [Mortierella alpina]|nr:hypothetical protein EC968_001076 [Mortierella alpina]
MESLAPPFIDSITQDRAAVLAQAWLDCEAIPPKAGLMRIAQQTSLDFRVVRYWFYCRSNYEGIVRAFDALGPKQKLEFPTLDEYYLFDRFTDDPDAPDATHQTPQAIGQPHYASIASNQQSQPAHAQPESSTGASAQGRARRASTAAKTKQQNPSTPAKKRQQRPPAQKPNENGKRRQDPASEDREVKAAAKARTKRTKTSAVSTAPPATAPLPEVAPAVGSTAESDATERALQPTDDISPQDTTTEAASTLSMTTAPPPDTDSTPSLTATSTQDKGTAPAEDVTMADVTAVTSEPSSAATKSSQASEDSEARQPKMIMSAVVIPPYKGSLSGSSTPTSSRRHITTLRLPPSALQSVILGAAAPATALETETIDALTSASAPKTRFKLIRNRMDPRKQSRCSSNSEESIGPSTYKAVADPAIQEELVLQAEHMTAMDAPIQETPADATVKVAMKPKRRAKSTMAISDSEPNSTSIEIQLEKRSKSVPVSVSKEGESESQTTPELQDSRERVLEASDQDQEIIHAVDISRMSVEKVTLSTEAGHGIMREVKDKEAVVMEDQEEGHLGTVHSKPIIVSKANISQQPTSLTVTKTRDGGDLVQGDKQNERCLEQQQSARLSQSRSRGPSTAPTRAATQAPSRPRLSPPHSEIRTAQHDIAVDALESETIGPAASNKEQQERGATAQLLWDQPWSKQYASIKPMKRRSMTAENGIAASPSNLSQSASIINSSSCANNTMAPDERMASEKKIVSMDQTPPTPKSTDDTERQARTAQNNASRRFEGEESTMTAPTQIFPNGSPYMEAQTDEMDAGGSSYSPDATYDCLSPTAPYYSGGTTDPDI